MKRRKIQTRSNDQVKKLEGSLNFYSELEVLDLSQNQVQHLGRSPFMGQVKLKQLNLSTNLISSLTHPGKKGVTGAGVPSRVQSTCRTWT